MHLFFQIWNTANPAIPFKFAAQQILQSLRFSRPSRALANFKVYQHLFILSFCSYLKLYTSPWVFTRTPRYSYHQYALGGSWKIGNVCKRKLKTLVLMLLSENRYVVIESRYLHQFLQLDGCKNEKTAVPILTVREFDTDDAAGAGLIPFC